MVFSILTVSNIARTWQMNSNHYVDFLAHSLGLATCMPKTSIKSHVALMADWHPLQQSCQDRYLTLQSIYRI